MEALEAWWAGMIATVKKETQKGGDCVKMARELRSRLTLLGLTGLARASLVTNDL